MLLLTIALLSATGASYFTTSDLNVLLKIYGLLFTVQVGFLLFFVMPILQQYWGSKAKKVDF